MFFSRILIATVAVVGVIAAPSNAPGTLHHDSINVVGHSHHGRDAAPYAVAKPKFEALQDQVADAMAGPQSERESKLIAITSTAYDIVKEYNNGFKARWTAQSLYPQLGQKREELANVASALYHILRSCKGTRSAQLATNIGNIYTETDGMGDWMASQFPDIKDNILAGWDKYTDSIAAIQSAVSA